ncbi:MAG: ROK family protein [Clostridia bacterium]|nr:ROK family protein [Clostridia bacterium]
MKVGIDLGGSHIGIGIIDKNNTLIEKTEKRLMSEDKKNIKESIQSFIIDNILQLKKQYDISEIGIAVPGTVTERLIVRSVNLGVQNYPLVDILEKKIKLPVKMRNDAKCAALAEVRNGALKNYKRTVFLTLGTGIGGAVIIDNNLLNTGDFPGCEFGHIVIQKDGIECNCGKKGCFEKYASMKAFKNNLRETLGLDENTKGEELLQIIRKNPDEEKIKRIIQDFIEYLSIGISNLINIFEPEAVGIGGSFVYFSDILLEKLKQNIIEKEYLFNEREDLVIVPAVLGNDAGILGSV